MQSTKWAKDLNRHLTKEDFFPSQSIVFYSLFLSYCISYDIKYNVKMSGERGHLCLILDFNWKVSSFSPLSMM